MNNLYREIMEFGEHVNCRCDDVIDVTTTMGDARTRLIAGHDLRAGQAVWSAGDVITVADMNQLNSREFLRLPEFSQKEKISSPVERCRYCGRKNKVERELCASCGAPL